MAWYNSAVHAVGNVVGPAAVGLGTVEDYLTPGKGSGTLTDVGHAITSGTSTANNFGAINPFVRGSVFSVAPTSTGSSGSASTQQQYQGGGDQTGGTYSQSQYYDPSTGGYTTSNPSGSGGVDYSPQIASIDAQTNALQGNLGYADTQLSQGLGNLQSQFNQQQSGANTNHSRALQDFQTTEQNDNLGHTNAIDQVNTKARTLSNSVRQMIGNASGSGSSAYQITAPGAVQRQADLQSQAVNTNFGQNMDALKTSKDREGQDYNSLMTQLQDKFTQGQNGLRTGIEQQKQQINGTLADLAAQRAAYLGGGIKGAQAAASPFQANAASSQSAIDNIAKQYQSPFATVAPVQVAAPTLRDYVTGKTQVATNQAGTQATNTPVFNPLATWQKQDQNQYSF